MGTQVLGSRFLNATAVSDVASAFGGGGLPKGAGNGNSVTYRGIIGEPHLLMLSVADDGDSSGSSGSGPVQAVSQTKIELIPGESHPGTGDPMYLMYVQATLATNLTSVQSTLQQLVAANALGLSDYMYRSVSGAPTLCWFGAIQNLGDLQALGDPVSKVQAKAGGALKELGGMITSISSALLLKV